jgi:S1-C subfamily serine protease
MPHFPALWGSRPHWNLELTNISEPLGEYFNTDRGLLVLRAPTDNPLTLKDGDVILSIDGREPRSPTHALRILRSYQPGERVEIEIMRKRRKSTLEVTMPEHDRR